MKFQSMVLLTVLCGLQAGGTFAAEQPVAGSAEKGQAKAALASPVTVSTATA